MVAVGKAIQISLGLTMYIDISIIIVSPDGILDNNIVCGTDR